IPGRIRFDPTATDAVAALGRPVAVFDCGGVQRQRPEPNTVSVRLHPIARRFWWMRLQAYPPYRHDRFRRVDKRSASTVNRPRAIEFPPWPKPDDKPRFHESLPSAS